MSDHDHRGGAVRTALSTSVHGNATAFGFSIMITVTFGATQAIEGSPTIGKLLLYGLSAALAVGLLEGLVSAGFRRQVGEAASEVLMLGTAMNMLSVSAGAGAGIAMAELLDGAIAWALAGFAAALLYIMAESAEVLLAEGIQRLRGDPSADEERSQD